jgi:hypothetical protein
VGLFTENKKYSDRRFIEKLLEVGEDGTGLNPEGVRDGQ